MVFGCLLLKLSVFPSFTTSSNLKYINGLLVFLTRTQLKKFLGKSVKKAKHLAEEYGEKAVNKVKSVRDEGKKKKEKEVKGCCAEAVVFFLKNHTAYIHVPVDNLLNITRKCPVQLQP